MMRVSRRNQQQRIKQSPIAECIERHSSLFSYKSDAFSTFLNRAIMRYSGREHEPETDAAKQVAIKEMLTVYDNLVRESPPFTDLLGPVHYALGLGNTAKGQFFTPQAVARCMAEMTLSDYPPSSEPPWLMGDPCCGAGVMMMQACAVILARYGATELQKWRVHGYDVDMICTLMYACQMLANLSIHKLSLAELVAANGDSLFGKMQIVIHAKLAPLDAEAAA